MKKKMSVTEENDELKHGIEKNLDHKNLNKLDIIYFKYKTLLIEEFSKYSKKSKCLIFLVSILIIYILKIIHQLNNNLEENNKKLDLIINILNKN